MSELETYYFMSHFPGSMTMNPWEMTMNQLQNVTRYLISLVLTTSVLIVNPFDVNQPNRIINCIEIGIIPIITLTVQHRSYT